MTHAVLDDAVFERALRAIDASDFTSYIFQYPPLALWGPPRGFGSVAEAWRRTAERWPALGMYVHVPFCKTKCTFCRFFVIESDRGSDFDAYIEGLEREAALLSGLFTGRVFSHLYIGGGTPSLLPARHLEALFSILRGRFSFDPGGQTAFEANPEFLDREKLGVLKACGVDRLTIGVQSFDEDVIRAVDRTQERASVYRAYGQAREAGIARINIDLMCGLPGQTPRVYLQDIREVLRLRPDMVHTSLFMPTPFTRFVQREGVLPAEEEARTRAMHAAGLELLRKFGYRPIQYDSLGLDDEARNKQLEDSVVRGVPFLGLGPGAVSSATGELRYVNAGSLGGYVKQLKDGRLPILRSHAPTSREEQTNFALNNLWYGELPRRPFERLFGVRVEDSFGPQLEALEAGGWIAREDDAYRLREMDDRGRREARKAFFGADVAERLLA